MSWNSQQDYRKKPEGSGHELVAEFIREMLPKIEKVYKNIFLEPDGFERALKRSSVNIKQALERATD
jgi:hypothetical protein